MQRLFSRVFLGFIFLLTTTQVQAVQWQESVLEVGEMEIPVYTAVPEGKAYAQVLWLPSENGLLAEERELAQQFAERGIEVTLLNPYEALFLAPTVSAFEQISVQWITTLIADMAHVDLPIWLIAPNKAGILALKAAEKMQLEQPIRFMGMLLLNPNLYLNTPEPGKKAEFWPQVENANLPISIVQGELTSLRWRLPELQSALEQQGSDVFVQLIPEVRDRFYFRPDALPVEKQIASEFADYLIEAMRWQVPYLQQSRRLNHSSETAESQQTRSLQLKPYQGKQNLPLQLFDTEGRMVDLQAMQGKVVLVNFWASWCPPCVHEMPSMAMLKQSLEGKPFDILAVNLGESKEAIAEFEKTFTLNFPILLDPQGQAVKDWQVFAYPSSYLIDAQGQIRYALFGGTDWMEAHHREKIAELFDDLYKITEHK
ncbi:cytochrome c biogenesis protein CcmG, thiol:disulfide interchange protein DsbE [uncultured Thiomicrorhabdus sp.]